MKKLTILSYWQGEELTFDIFPPPMPSPNAVLHWEKEPGITLGPGVNVVYSLEPVDNPNHLVITVPHADLHVLNGNPNFGQVFPDPDRRIVNAYMLWWEYGVPAPASSCRPSAPSSQLRSPFTNSTN